MDLVNELENDLALAFLVDKNLSEKIDSAQALILMDRIREVLQPLSVEEDLTETTLIPGTNENVLAH